MKHLDLHRKKSNSYYKVMLMALVVIVLATALLWCSIKPTEVFALTTDKFNTAYLAGEGEDLWNSSTKDINAKVLDDINQMIFGENDPVSYIKGSTFLESQTLAQVVPAATINSTIKTKTNNTKTNGMLVTLGGKQWIAASVTLGDGEKKDNVILTLYLANAEDSSKFTYKTSINTGGSPTTGYGTKGDNMYSSSHLRYGLLHDEKWSLFNTTNADGDSFAQQFLVQPKNIKYQRTQSAKGRYVNTSDTSCDTPGEYRYRWQNESLDDIVNQGEWHSYLTPQGPYTASYTYNDETGIAQRYDAWGNDYIWIPSWTETGDTTYVNGGRSIWDLSNDQLAHSTTNSYTWLRSGLGGSYSYAYVLASSGVHNNHYVTTDLGVRPALHLNLTSAALGAAGRGVTPTEESGYDYIYKDSNNIRQGYTTNEIKHLRNDENIVPVVDGKKRYVIGNIKPETKLLDFVSNLKNDQTTIKIYDNKNTLLFDGVTQTDAWLGKGDVNKNKLVATGFKVEAYQKNSDTGAMELYDTVYLSVLGDVVANGQINTLDITVINRIANGQIQIDSLSLEQQLAAMVDNKGKVTSVDGKILLNIMSGDSNAERYFENIAIKEKYQIWNLTTDSVTGKTLREGTDIAAAADLANNAIIGNIELETKVSEFKTKLAAQAGISASTITLYKKNGNVAGDNDFVATGCYINYSGKTIYLSVLGDLTGDGIANSLDVTYLNRLVNGSITLDLTNTNDKLTMLAAILQNKGNLTTADSECILNYIGGNLDISKYF